MPNRGPYMSPSDMRLVPAKVRQRVQRDLNSCLRNCAANLAVEGWWSQLLPHHMAAHRRSDRVAGCSGQLVRPWWPGPRHRLRIGARSQGGGWLAPTDSLSWKAPQLSSWKIVAGDSRGRTEPHPKLAVTLECWFARITPLSGLLLTSRHCFYWVPAVVSQRRWWVGIVDCECEGWEGSLEYVGTLKNWNSSSQQHA